MNQHIKNAIFNAVNEEPFSKMLKMKLIDLDKGYSKVEMKYNPSKMNNIFAKAHGGAVFSLIDEAFQTAAQTEGSVCVALNVSVTYVSTPSDGSLLCAEAKEISRTKKTSNYIIKVFDHTGQITATCQALAYRTSKPLPFLDKI